MIVGINGFKRSGKDTAGKYLCETYGFKRLANADLVRTSIAALFGLDTSNSAHQEIIKQLQERSQCTVQVLVGKKVLAGMDFLTFIQRFATEAVRDVLGQDVWLDALFRKHHVDMHVESGARYVVTDARFANELKAIAEVGGYNVRLERLGLESGGHRSEQLPPESLIHEVIQNDSTIHNLHRKLDALMQTLMDREALLYETSRKL
jgi:hypothetical protein